MGVLLSQRWLSPPKFAKSNRNSRFPEARICTVHTKGRRQGQSTIPTPWGPVLRQTRRVVTKCVSLSRRDRLNTRLHGTAALSPPRPRSARASQRGGPTGLVRLDTEFYAARHSRAARRRHPLTTSVTKHDLGVSLYGRPARPQTAISWGAVVSPGNGGATAGDRSSRLESRRGPSSRCMALLFLGPPPRRVAAVHLCLLYWDSPCSQKKKSSTRTRQRP